MPERSEHDAAQMELHRLRAALRNANREIAAKQHEIQRLNEALAITQTKLDESWDQLRTLRNSVSWRVTMPLRLGTRGNQ
ncbi:hypothetical protein [Actinomyces mediterranea]|uniref:hypothetical protein n=1 Tax=Actinomyces mediterranea TaxID=1871028 RepID=UPI0009FAB9B7|nr:hypothetical protein [Actinomyces mediterranea]